jgi:hypothetical protein
MKPNYQKKNIIVTYQRGKKILFYSQINIFFKLIVWVLSDTYTVYYECFRKRQKKKNLGTNQQSIEASEGSFQTYH